MTNLKRGRHGGLASSAAPADAEPAITLSKQIPQSASQQSDAAGTEENNGEDFTRPQNLFQVRGEYRTAPGTGSEPGTTRTVTTNQFILRADGRLDIAPQWTVALRTDLPFSERNPISADNPTGGFVQGVGDADVQAAIINTLNARWAAGAALRTVAPTGDPDLTSGKWQALPIVGARVMLPELSEGSFFTGLARYDVSFAGDPSSRNISNLQLAPTLNVICRIAGLSRYIQNRTYATISAIRLPDRPADCSCRWIFWSAAL